MKPKQRQVATLRVLKQRQVATLRMERCRAEMLHLYKITHMLDVAGYGVADDDYCCAMKLLSRASSDWFEAKREFGKLL